uniref:uncharacterized protein LOC122595376 n=1 Tax=Erigeron canadensis TaxID=72917 RepID=UPI001CB914F0|nr:uncharacterized protein LOC122595376 [Erigeron canadensis]
MTPRIDYEEFVHHIEQETEYDVYVFVDYYSLDLSKYVEKRTVDENEGEIDENEGEFVSKTEHGESSKGPNEEPCDSDDESYAPSSDSDVDFVASLDHLSEWEDEMREVRKGNPIAKIPTPRQLPKLGSNRQGHEDEECVKTTVHTEHENFINELIEALKSKDGETSNDPLKPSEPELPKFPTHDPSTHWRLRRPQVGELYTNHNQLRECLSYYALANGYTLWFERSCKTSLIAKCKTRPPNISDPSKGKQRKHIRFPAKQQKCKFRCFARLNNEKSFQIMSLVDEHTCARNFKYGSLVNYKWIGKHFAERIRSQPEIRLCEIQNLVMKKYKCTISSHQARRARTYALTEYEKTLEEHYGMLNSYGQAILKTNPGSTVQLGITTNPDGKTYFDRFYTCFYGLKQGWRFGCRRVVALDGCFLKKPLSGKLLTTVGRNGNNQVYPICWAIVNVENKHNWTWFLQLLSHDLDCPDGAELTLISDQHKGLIEAVKDVMPRAEHKQCARHIYENFRKLYSGVEFRNLFWKAAKSTYMAQYEAAMQEIKVANPNAYNYLIERNPKSWCRAFFEIHRGCEAVENGFSECWNSVLLKIKNKPIITLLEALRVIVMIRLESMRDISENWEHDVCPTIRNKLELIKKDRACGLVIHAGDNIFEVRMHNYSYSVSLDEGSCTRRMWELSGIPCIHAIEAIYKCNRDPEEYISCWFRKANYIQAYNKTVYPVGGMDTWLTVNLPKPLPPKSRTMPADLRRRGLELHMNQKLGQPKLQNMEWTCIVGIVGQWATMLGHVILN